MPIDPTVLANDFARAASSADIDGWPCAIHTECLYAPHTPPALPAGHGAVYMFVLGERLGSEAPAGPGTVLKVGRVGPGSAPRFSYQHYGTSAPSTLAKSLLRYRVLWPWLGITHIDASSVQTWMFTHLDRIHFYVLAEHNTVLPSLEIYLRARVDSVFEGAA